MAGIEWLLTTVHETSGLPWWASIALTTVAIRVTLVPVQVYSSKSIAKLNLIKPQLDAIKKEMDDGASKGTEKGLAQAQRAQREYNKLTSHHGVSPIKGAMGPLVQLPLWLSFFFTMRHITRADAGLGLDTGGLLWFPDLTQSDPYYILPVLCGGTFYGMVQLGDAGTAAGANVDPKQQMMKTAMKFVAVAMVPGTAWFQSGIFVYWISSNSFQMTQTVLLRQPMLRDLVGLPPLPGTAQALAAAASGANILPQQTAVSLGGSVPPPPVASAVKAKAKGKRSKHRKR